MKPALTEENVSEMAVELKARMTCEREKRVFTVVLFDIQSGATRKNLNCRKKVKSGCIRAENSKQIAQI